MNRKITIIGILIIVLVTFAIGCVESPVDEALNRIDKNLEYAEAELNVAWAAFKREDFENALERAYTARSYYEKGFSYYQKIEPELTETKRTVQLIIFEITCDKIDLTIDTIHWGIEAKSFRNIPRNEKIRTFIPKFERFIKRTEELNNAYEKYGDKLEFIQRTQPDLLIRDAHVSAVRELHIMLETYAKESRITLSELKDLMPKYIPIDDRVNSPIIVIPSVDKEIIPSDLAQFFDSFDTNGNMKLDIREGSRFFYWVEVNVIYRHDDEKAHLKPDFFPRFPVGDGRPGPNYWQTPHETWIERAGDCEDMAILQVAFYNHFNISTKVALVATKIPGEINHAIAIVKISDNKENIVKFLGEIKYYEIDGHYYMLVDNAYSNEFGTLSRDPIEGTFKISKRYTLEEAYEKYKHLR